jgi:predicted HTH transcriptional regulator
MVEAEILMRQLEEDANRDIKGESEEVEFKEKVPVESKDFAKEIAAFASTKGGRIYLGIKDNGDISGIVETTEKWFDKLQLWIDSIACDLVEPSLEVSVKKFFVGNKVIVQINVPEGSEPTYYVRGVPYIRKMTKSRPATPAEVKRLHNQYFINAVKKTID